MRSLSPPWASLLTEAFLITTVAVSAAMAVVGHCPRSLDCARERRHFCQPSSSHCGPCLDPFVENKRGKCVIRRRNRPAVKVSHLPELDEEIDIISSIISKHRESEMKHSGKWHVFCVLLSCRQRSDSKIPESGATSDEENEDGDFTVYECPGLAPTGEMEVKNPLFDDSTFHLHLQRSYN
ncbi:neural proliferation differentiation and control protein 1-like [Sinocyclocheilus rhinocerous]|uniref:neural proliferation differentiation and control protein 1-like n=1 Tax=Sinocyclocheilus rhinocerous TaxID=307959 RepID=UPI0007B83A37|nr:PREDICTED: neural proliferation differentiation and control protein 1-like [Sinocyclocheilus rhinocerous]